MVRTKAWVFYCLAIVLVPALAQAQASRYGPTFSLGGTTSPIDAPDVAHDNLHNQYLQVAGKTFIEAHLVNAAGTLLATFRVNATGEYAQTPRVAFSPDVAGGGGYLVTWHASIGNFARVRGRLFRFDGTPVTSDFEIGTSAVSGGTSSNWTMGAAVSYATGSKEFLVAWMGYYTSTNDVFFQRVSSSGALLGGNTLVSPGTPDWERDPSVAYNPNTDEFFIAYAAYSDASRVGYVCGRRVRAGSGAFTSSQLQFGSAVATYVPAVTYNTSTQQYLLGWYNRTASAAAVYGVTLDANGGLIGGIRVLSPFYAAYDALDIDYNPVAGQSLLVTHGGGAAVWEDAAVSILGNGNAYDNGFIITNTTDVRALRANPANNDGNFNPRMAASGLEGKWLMATSSVFAAVHAQFAATAATGGPVAPPPAAPPAAAVSHPLMAIDIPTAGSSVAGPFYVAGWAADTGSASGTGVDIVHVYAHPTSGATPIFIGAASMGYARPDVAAYLGDGRFSPVGFGVAGSLPPGTYDLVAYAFSSVTGTFNNAVSKRITVITPVSKPRMFVDTPAQNQTITQNVSVGGWAIDLASSLGAGMEGVHVWAYPTSGAAPIFIGAGGVGYARPDVAANFGSAQFAPSGFYVQGTLPPGEYTIVVYGFSAVTRTFTQAISIRVRVV